MRLDAEVKTAVSLIPEDACPMTGCTDVVSDEQTTRFSARCHVRGPAGVCMV